MGAHLAGLLPLEGKKCLHVHVPVRGHHLHEDAPVPVRFRPREGAASAPHLTLPVGAPLPRHAADRLLVGVAE